MRIAFYAPLKAPTHPVPSGDRLIGRLVVRALEHAGHEVELASRLRAREGAGDAARQRRIARLGERVARRVGDRFVARTAAERPRCWLTYHLYDKAPDWLGPPVARRLGIPYVVAEASVAASRADAAWAAGYRAAADAIRAAARVVAINGDDVPGVARLRGGEAGIVHVAPFLGPERFPDPGARAAHRAALAAGAGLDPEVPWLVAVAMMRPGRKAASYALLAEALARVADRPWRLVVAGDGEARADVERAFAAALGAGRAAFLGARDDAEITRVLAACDLMAWPALREPLGMAMLEAHAAGLAVVAGRERGVADIVRDGETGVLVAPGDADALAAAIAALLDDPARRRAMGEAARRVARAGHGLDAGAARLDAVVRGAVAEAERAR